MIEDEVGKLWESVKSDIPPPPDYALDSDIIEGLLPQTRKGERKILTAKPEAQKLIAEYAKIEAEIEPIKATLKPLEAKKKAVKTQLLQLVGNAESVTIGDYLISASEQEKEDRFVYGDKKRNFKIYHKPKK